MEQRGRLDRLGWIWAGVSTNVVAAFIVAAIGMVGTAIFAVIKDVPAYLWIPLAAAVFFTLSVSFKFWVDVGLIMRSNRKIPEGELEAIISHWLLDAGYEIKRDPPTQDMHWQISFTLGAADSTSQRYYVSMLTSQDNIIFVRTAYVLTQQDIEAHARIPPEEFIKVLEDTRITLALFDIEVGNVSANEGDAKVVYVRNTVAYDTTLDREELYSRLHYLRRAESVVSVYFSRIARLAGLYQQAEETPSN